MYLYLGTLIKNKMKKFLTAALLLISISCFSNQDPIKFEVEKSYITILDKFEYIRVFNTSSQELVILNRREPTIDLNRLENGQYRIETDKGTIYISVKGNVFCILTDKK